MSETITKPTALIIEDDLNLSIIFSKALEMAGFQTEVIQDGLAARERLSTSLPDVIALDLHLPNISGDKLLEYMKTLPNFDQTRIIITSADPQLASQFEDDVHLILIKPISFTQLRDLAIRLK